VQEGLALLVGQLAGDPLLGEREYLLDRPTSHVHTRTVPSLLALRSADRQG
jgi:hypothetical protein